jgi:hypothetical protein
MKLVSKTNETKTVELTAIELHLLTSALGDYQYRALDLTRNYHHADAVTELWSQMVDVYCED